MKTKKEFVSQHGMVECRRRGLCDKWDQLLYASRELAGELLRHSGVCQKPQDGNLTSRGSALGYLMETLNEFGEE